jgi:hypothetical protein
MDLSKYSDEDYEKLKKGDVKGLSDQGYLTYKQQHQQFQQALQKSQNPDQIPDAADKVAAGGKPQSINGYAKKFVESQHQGPGGFLRNAADTATAVAGGIGSLGGLFPTKYPGMDDAMKEHPIASEVGGYAGQAAATPIAGAAVGKLAQFLGKGAQAAGTVAKSGGLDTAANVVGAVNPAVGFGMKSVSKLAKLLGSIAEAGTPAAEEAGKDVVKLTSDQLANKVANKNWTFPTR